MEDAPANPLVAGAAAASGADAPEPESSPLRYSRTDEEPDEPTVPPLALSAFLTGNATQAQRAAMLVRVWFLDEKSRMNPNLNYAQAIPGANNGTDGGIIDISDHHKLL